MLSVARKCSILASVLCRVPRMITGTRNISQKNVPTRHAMIADIKAKMDAGEEFDILVVGGGCTGAGAALDAAARGLSVACFERADFSSGTSSRSTKLLWGGSRYLVTAFVNLLSTNLLKNPSHTVSTFIADFKMVMNCHRERRFMLEKQAHLTNWLPIAVPFTTWIMNPPPFGFLPALFGPLGLFVGFFKFYDSLSGFSCPPSHIMTKKRAQRKFPQLDTDKLKYCSVFYEGQHDDSRTNLAIAQSAAMHGADILNYADVVEFLKDEEGRLVGAIVEDGVGGERLTVKAKSVLLAGGPFLDQMRGIYDDPSDESFKKAVRGASGVHVILPQYFAPSGIGLVDMSTSDGRFLFLLPWGNRVLVGTTDRPAEASMEPIATESEIVWILNEASKFLSDDLSLRRQDVLSAWSGVRPLAVDPFLPQTKGEVVSRDHVIGVDPISKAVFVTGGKWTTYREMAEDAVDRVIQESENDDKNDGKRSNRLVPTVSAKSTTLNIGLKGNIGYSSHLYYKLQQRYGIPKDVAENLSKYGAEADEIMNIEVDGRKGRRLVSGFPYLQAEVIHAVRQEWAVNISDILQRRTRLAFLDRERAIAAIPTVLRLLAQELGWDEKRQELELQLALQGMLSFSGHKARQDINGRPVRMDTLSDIREAFSLALESHGQEAEASLDQKGVQILANMLEHPLDEEALEVCMSKAKGAGVSGGAGGSKGGGGGRRITLEEFADFWNSEECNPNLSDLKRDMQIGSKRKLEGSGAVFS